MKKMGKENNQEKFYLLFPMRRMEKGYFLKITIFFPQIRKIKKEKYNQEMSFFQNGGNKK